jgi:hypothetical protein
LEKLPTVQHNVGYNLRREKTFVREREKGSMRHVRESEKKGMTWTFVGAGDYDVAGFEENKKISLSFTY